MSRVRVIALGNRDAGDDGAALDAVALATANFELTPAGRPGARLLELLSEERATVVVDVTRGAGTPGTVTTWRLDELSTHVGAQAQVSSHGFGPAETLQLAAILGRTLPLGIFVGIEGECFEPGVGLSPSIVRALPNFVAALDEAVATLAVDPARSAEDEGVSRA